MSNDPFQNFENASVKLEIQNKVLNASRNKINPNSTTLFLKYGALFIITVFISLIICPQRGFSSLINSDFILFHHLLHQSEILCGLYCGFIFFLTTHLLTFFLLTKFEKVKVIKYASFVPALFMSAFFGLSMTSLFSSASLDWSYNLSWAFIVGASYCVTNKLCLRRLELS